MIVLFKFKWRICQKVTANFNFK